MIINPVLNPFYNPNPVINPNYPPGNPHNIAWFAVYEAASRWLANFESQDTRQQALSILFQDLTSDYWLLLTSFQGCILESNIRIVQTEIFCRVRRYIENFYKLKNLANDPDFLWVINAKENNKEKDEKLPDKYENHKDSNGFITLRGLGECLRANDEGIIKDFDSDVLFEVGVINGKLGGSLYSTNQKNYNSVDGKSILHPIYILSGIAKTANSYVHGSKIWEEGVTVYKLRDQLQGIFYMCLECLHIALKRMMEIYPLYIQSSSVYYYYDPNYDPNKVLENLYKWQRKIIKTNLTLNSGYRTYY